MATRSKGIKKSRPFEAGADKVGQDRSMNMLATGDVKDMKRTDQIIEPVEGPNIKAKIELEAFMNEMVDVVVSQSTDPNAENPVEIKVNGISQYFIRGATQSVKRKYVEVLARAKQTSVKTTEYTDQGSGSRAVRVDKATALRYPFTVLNDRNPNGAAWLRKVLQEA